MPTPYIGTANKRQCVALVRDVLPTPPPICLSLRLSELPSEHLASPLRAVQRRPRDPCAVAQLLATVAGKWPESAREPTVRDLRRLMPYPEEAFQAAEKRV